MTATADTMFAIPAGALESDGRLLECTRCGDTVRVYEATAGAMSPAEHRFLDADSYVCGECLETRGVDGRALELRAAIDRERQAAAATGDGIPY